MYIKLLPFDLKDYYISIFEYRLNVNNTGKNELRITVIKLFDNTIFEFGMNINKHL